MLFDLEFEIKWTVPNILSLLRILMIPLFASLYLLSGADNNLAAWAVAVLALSGLTDLVDGFIARRYDLVSDFGKLLDPLADKLTQVTVVICVATRHSEMILLAVICFVKELGQAIGGLLLLHKGDEVRGARWWGKVSTAVFYGAMMLVVLWRDMPPALFWGLTALVGAFMLIAFIGYCKTFFGARKELKHNETESP